MGSGGGQTIGYKYSMGMHMILCHGPVDKLSRIVVGEREAWGGSVTANTTITINKPELFGGEQKEGGIVGSVDIMMGASDQTPNSYLISQLGAIMPAFRGVVSAVLRKVYVCAMSPYPKPWAFLVTRNPKSWYPAKAVIDGSHPDGGSANAAHIIYETLTHPDWGMGYSEAALDLSTFQAMADTLYAENFGLSFVLNSTDSIESFLYTVLTHVNGMLYTDPVTGKFAVKLLRYDYDPSALPLYNESNIIALDNYERPAFGEMVNEVVVTYRPKGKTEDATVTLQDLASVQAQEGVISQTVNYPGIDNADNAARVAMRDVRQKSTPLARVKLRVNRAAWDLTIGKCFRFAWAEHKVVNLVIRVLNINLGDLNDQTIIIDGVEDVFGLPVATYLTDQPSLWTNPVQAPGVVSPRKVFEATYWDLARGLDPANFESLQVSSTFISSAGGAPTYAASNYELWTHPGSSSFVKADNEEFCPHGVLVTTIGRTNNTFTVTLKGGDFTNFPVGGYAIIEDEIVRVDSVNLTTGVVVVGRGCLDTTPQAHNAGAAVLFAMGYLGFDTNEYASGETVSAKLLTRTPTGLLSQSAAPTDSVVTVGRQGRPYPPGNLRINGLSYPLSVNDTMTITWAHRDRTQQLATLVDYTTGNIGPEVGVTYSARLLRASDNAVLTSAANITGTTWAPPIYAQGEYIAEVWAVRAGLASFQKATHRFALELDIGAGWDFNWDANWGLGPAQAKIVSFTVGGAVDVGATVRVTLDGIQFTYVEQTGDTLADIADELKTLIDAHADYTVTILGTTFYVTGLPRSNYSVVTTVLPTSGYVDASAGITQTAAPARAGNRKVMFFTWDGTPSTKPISYHMAIRKSNAVEGEPDTVFFTAKKTSFIGDTITGEDVEQAMMFLGSDAGVPGDHGINYLADAAGVDIYCMERSGTWPADWCEGWDTVPLTYDAAIAFPVGEVCNFRYNLGQPVVPPQAPGTWQTYAYTNPGNSSLPPTNANYYFDPNISFTFRDGANFLDYVAADRPQITVVDFQRVLGDGVTTVLKVAGYEYKYVGGVGDDTEDALNALATKVNGRVVNFTPNTSFSRVVSLNTGEQYMLEFNDDMLPKSRLTTSADNGATFTTDSYADMLMAGTYGVDFFDGKIGTKRFSLLQSLSASLHQVIQQDGTAAPTITDRFQSWPQDSGTGVNIGAACGDGSSTFYIVARKIGDATAPTAMYLYTTTDGLTLTLVGAMSTDGTDPNGVDVSARAGFNSTFFIPGSFTTSKSLLFKSGTRWFMRAATGYSLYYTDDSVPLANWKRCPVGLNEDSTVSEQYPLVSVVASGGNVFANNRNVLGNCVSYSTDNGSTWTALTPPGLSTQAPLWLNIVGTKVIGPLYNITSTPQAAVADLSAPGTWTIINPTGFDSGLEYSTQNNFANYGTALIAVNGGTGKVRRTTDGTTWTAVSSSSDIDMPGTNSIAVTVDTDDPLSMKLVLTGQPNVPFTATGYSVGSISTSLTYNVDQPAF